MYRAIIFDFDYTLGDATQAEFEALPHVFIGEDIRDIAAFVGI